MGEPGARRGDALGLVVVGESWGGSVGVRVAERGAGTQLRAGRGSTEPCGTPERCQQLPRAPQLPMGMGNSPGQRVPLPLPGGAPKPMTPLTCEPPPRGAAAGQLHHARGEHQPEEQPAHQPESDTVVGTPGCRAPPQQAQGGHQHCQEPRFQQQAVPAGEHRCPHCHPGATDPLGQQLLCRLCCHQVPRVPGGGCCHPCPSLLPEGGTLGPPAQSPPSSSPPGRAAVGLTYHWK